MVEMLNIFAIYKINHPNLPLVFIYKFIRKKFKFNNKEKLEKNI